MKNSVVRDRIRVHSFALGIMEACKLDGEMFGIGRLESLLCQLINDFSMTNIITQVNEFAGADEQDDDITIIGFEKK